MNPLYGERTLHRRQRAQARIGALELLHDEPVRGVTKARAAVLFQIRSVEAQRAHARRKMLREFARTMARNDLGQDFLLHKTSRLIACCAFLVCEKFFDVVVIERAHLVQWRASLATARREHNALSLAVRVSWPDKPIYFVPGNPAAFQALKPPAM